MLLARRVRPAAPCGLRQPTTAAGGLAAIIGEAAVAVATEAPTGAQQEKLAPAAEVAGMAACTAAPEVEEKAWEVVATIGASGAAGKGSRGKGGHSSSDGHGGHRGHS